jgi:hypothetical protein
MKKNKKYYLWALYLSFILTFKFWLIETIEVPYSLQPGMYVSSYSFIQGSDIKSSRTAKNIHDYLRPEKIKSGDIVYVDADSFPTFYHELFPKIKSPFVLVVTSKNATFPGGLPGEIDMDSFLSDHRVKQVFAQNCDYQGLSNNISCIPCGLDFAAPLSKRNLKIGRRSPMAQERKIEDVVHKLKPLHQRSSRVCVDIGFNEQDLDVSVLDSLDVTDRVDPFLLFDDLRIKKGGYAFVACPTDKQLDVSKVWENLILGCIVIVQSSPIDAVYQGLPVVIVDSWQELTQANLDVWLATYADAFSNPQYREKLTYAYWNSRISGSNAKL